jgi:hypothetical protein
VFTNYFHRPPPPTPAAAPTSGRPSIRFRRNARWRGTARLLPYMDDFMFLADSYSAAHLHSSTKVRKEGLIKHGEACGCK